VEEFDLARPGPVLRALRRERGWSIDDHPELVEGWFDRLTMKTLSLPKGDRLTMII
jgi:hypothetical protein